MLLSPRIQILGHQLAEHPTLSFHLQNLLMAISCLSRPRFPGAVGLICQTL